MAVDATGGWGQPNFLASGAPEVDIDPQAVSNYYAPLVPRRFANWAALVAAGAPPADGYMARVDTIRGPFFIRVGTAWVMHGIARFADAAARDAAITAPVAGWRSRVDTELFDRIYLNAGWRPAAAEVPLLPASVGGGTLAADGSFTFTAQTGLVLAGIGSSEFKHIRLELSLLSSAAAELRVRVRSGGVDQIANYQYNLGEQSIAGTYTRISSGADTYTPIGSADTALFDTEADIYSLGLPERTRFHYRGGDSAVKKRDGIGSHTLATAYPDLTVFPATGNFTGLGRLVGIAR